MKMEVKQVAALPGQLEVSDIEMSDNRRINGRCSTFSLGPTEQITLARLEHLASILQSAGSSPKP